MEEQTEYDFIICGGGTSGCVLASRLSASFPTLSILLLEAGGSSLEVEHSRMAGGLPKVLGTEHDWNFFSTAQTHANNRTISLTRGRFLGGSSALNGTLCVRGSKQDFDDWDMPNWSGEEVFRCMRKSETFHGKGWFDADEKAHGYDGPLNVEPHDVAPISERVLQSFTDKDFPYDCDMFSHGERAFGCGHVPRTVHEGLRSTAADFVSGRWSRSNLTIRYHSLIDKVNLEDDEGGLRAVGVDVVSEETGSKKTFTARREIIISAGTYCTPPILMRSGIGPRPELEKHDIECKVDLPGVGQNLQDHLIVFVPYEVEPGLTNDDKTHPPEALMASYNEWVTKKTGFLSCFPFGVFAFTRLDERLSDDPEWCTSGDRDPTGLTQKQPNIEYFMTECCAGPRELPPANGKNAFAFVTMLLGAKSTGSVALKSKDALNSPVIDCNYLADPMDLKVLTEGVRLGNEIVMQGKGTRDIIKGAYPADLTQHHEYTTREQWMPFVKQAATTCYHAAGTAKMGKVDDPDAVVDERLRVRSVQGLRVVDCSVMPRLHGGHTQMVAYAIGEKAAEMIVEDWTGIGTKEERKDSKVAV